MLPRLSKLISIYRSYSRMSSTRAASPYRIATSRQPPNAPIGPTNPSTLFTIPAQAAPPLLRAVFTPETATRRPVVRLCEYFFVRDSGRGLVLQAPEGPCNVHEHVNSINCAGVNDTCSVSSSENSGDSNARASGITLRACSWSSRVGIAVEVQ